jgi:CPA1 family monovalent cation:H+ antiporter
MDVRHLEGIPLLAGLSDRERRAIAQLADEVEVDPGTHLLTEGAFAHEFFIVLSGSVEVSVGGRPIATLVANDFFGEIALLQEERRTATVVTTTRCRLAAMSRGGFHEMSLTMPTITARLREAAAERARSR